MKLAAALVLTGALAVSIPAQAPPRPIDEKGSARLVAEHKVTQEAYLKRVTSDERFITTVDARWSGALPALFLYDRAGRPVRSFVGETDMSLLEEAVRKLL